MEKSLQGCTSKEEARQIYIDAKMRLMNAVSQEDSTALFFLAVIDKVYADTLKASNSSEPKLDILA